MDFKLSQKTINELEVMVLKYPDSSFDVPGYDFIVMSNSLFEYFKEWKDLALEYQKLYELIDEENKRLKEELKNKDL